VPVIASNNFLEDLAFVLSVAAAISVIFQGLRQPVVVGYRNRASDPSADTGGRRCGWQEPE
jgi:hypothetical protein